MYTRDGAYFGEYTARVRAITPVGNGNWSNDVTFKITEQLEPPGKLICSLVSKTPQLQSIQIIITRMREKHNYCHDYLSCNSCI